MNKPQQIIYLIIGMFLTTTVGLLWRELPAWAWIGLGISGSLLIFIEIWNVGGERNSPNNVREDAIATKKKSMEKDLMRQKRWGIGFIILVIIYITLFVAILSIPMSSGVILFMTMAMIVIGAVATSLNTYRILISTS